MASTARIEELMRILEQRPWTAEEQREVEMIIGDDERGPRPFEIEGDWPAERKYDRRSDKSGLDDGVPIPRNARTLGDLDLPGGTHVNLEWSNRRGPKEAAPTSRVDTLPMTRMVDPQAESEMSIRLNQLEAATKDLFAKLKALEDKLGVGKE